LNDIERNQIIQAEQIREEKRQVELDLNEVAMQKDANQKCNFDPNDPIFELEDENFPLLPEAGKEEMVKRADEDGVPFKCNNCEAEIHQAEDLKFCQFCAKSYCGKCQRKSRPYLYDNHDNSKRGQICVQCEKKFLYRAALEEASLIDDYEAKESKSAQ